MDNKLITAERAKEIANQRKHLLRVMELILEEAANGEMVTTYEGLSEETIAKLEELGYQIEVRCALSDNPMYVIYWK